MRRKPLKHAASLPDVSFLDAYKSMIKSIIYSEPEMDLHIVEIEKQKEMASEAIFFEVDILVQMMRAISVENLKGFALELTAMSINLKNKIGENFSMKCVLPVRFPDSLIVEYKSIENADDIHQQMDFRERLMLKYAIMTTDVSFFNTLWKGNKVLTCRFIIETISGESINIGPFKMIDLVRDFKK